MNFKISIITTSDVDGEFINDICCKLEDEFLFIYNQERLNCDIDILGFYLIVMSGKELAKKFAENKHGRKTVTDLQTGDKLKYFTIPVILESSTVSDMSGNDFLIATLNAITSYESGNMKFCKKNIQILDVLKYLAQRMIELTKSREVL